MKFSIQRKQLKALSRFSAIKDVRYYLCGIHVVQNNRGTYLESTNGHILGRLLIDETPVNGENSVIIPNDALKTLFGTAKQGNETLHFTVDGIKITVIQPDNSTMQFSAFDYLSDVLDIEYIVNSKKEYLGARILVAFGGPNIWINTRTKQVEGYWWGDSSILSYENDAMDLDSALSELYNC